MESEQPPGKHNYVLKIKDKAGGLETIDLTQDFEDHMAEDYKPHDLVFAVSIAYPGNSTCRDVWYNGAWHRI